MRMFNPLDLDIHYDISTDTYVLKNTATNVEITLPKKLTHEIHKLIRGK